MGHVDLAAVDAVEHLEGVHNRAAVQHVDLEAAAGHLVDPIDVLLAHLGEDVGRGPGRLQTQRRRLGARYLRHRDCGGAGNRCAAKEFAASRGRGFGFSHSYPSLWISSKRFFFGSYSAKSQQPLTQS
jgi:hypothetical protein